ncbi:pyridoxal-phosphate dependent enzyme [Lysinibacillus sp. NPDC056232]|uniref:pyridoxal-phosphate dependent enzyme n=1 Tax=Lysinibacillus sp. NPDC056232 TaxID=3345756 RepID=UPI0035DED439
MIHYFFLSLDSIFLSVILLLIWIYHDTIPSIQTSKLSQYIKEQQLEAEIIVKLEYLNPANSVKDRVAKAMIEDAEARGVLTKDKTIIETTSGNTGIGLAAIAATKGYKLVFIVR